MTTPTQQQLERLPVWAQDHIKDIQRQRDVAIRELHEWTDSNTPSPFSIDELVCTGETQGPSRYIRYVQTRRIVVNYSGVRLEVSLGNGSIELQWESGDRSGRHVAFIPCSFQKAEIIARENMRV